MKKVKIVSLFGIREVEREVHCVVFNSDSLEENSTSRLSIEITNKRVLIEPLLGETLNLRLSRNGGLEINLA
jgi:hypothetical protein